MSLYKPQQWPILWPQTSHPVCLLFLSKVERGWEDSLVRWKGLSNLVPSCAIMTSFYLQDSGSYPHFTFDSQVDLQVNGSSQQQSVEHSKSHVWFWFAASRENVRDSSECFLKGHQGGSAG